MPSALISTLRRLQKDTEAAEYKVHVSQHGNVDLRSVCQVWEMRCAIAQAKSELGQDSLSSVSISALRVRCSETKGIKTYGPCLADVELLFVRETARWIILPDYLSSAPLPKRDKQP